jgi:uncharacterized coiled-coil DUF342 family protein
MIKEQARNIFQLQTELIDTKVDMAVSNGIDRVVSQISDLRSEMHGFREDVNKRLIAVETKLGMVSEKRKAWYERFMDILFKTGWVWSSFLLIYGMAHFTVFTK